VITFHDSVTRKHGKQYAWKPPHHGITRCDAGPTCHHPQSGTSDTTSIQHVKGPAIPQPSQQSVSIQCSTHVHILQKHMYSLQHKSSATSTCHAPHCCYSTQCIRMHPAAGWHATCWHNTTALKHEQICWLEQGFRGQKNILHLPRLHLWLIPVNSSHQCLLPSYVTIWY
jgi:hypothetical protein